MATLYVNTTVQTSVADADAYVLAGANDLYLGTSGRLLALGDGSGSGLTMTGTSDAVLDGAVYGAGSAIDMLGAQSSVTLNGSAASGGASGV
jgi:hypothetical protein